MKPLLIMGSPRSGTTFLAHMVTRFFHLHICRDNGTMLRFHRDLSHYEPLSSDANLHRLLKHLFADHYFKERLIQRGMTLTPDEIVSRMSRRTYGELINVIFGAVAAQNGKAVWGYKRASFARASGSFVDDLFPDARFVHIIRDAREVALSMRKSGAALERSWHFGAVDWVSHVQVGREIGRHLGPERYLEVRYERFMAEPAEVLTEILDFSGQVPDRDQRVERIRKEIGTLVKSGNTEKWRTEVPASGVRLIERIAGPLLGDLGYPVMNPDISGAPIGAAERAWLAVERVWRNIFQGHLAIIGRYRFEVLKAQWRARVGG